MERAWPKDASSLLLYRLMGYMWKGTQPLAEFIVMCKLILNKSSYLRVNAERCTERRPRGYVFT